MHRRNVRPTILPKLGKRRRRALIRLRHALAAQKFFRWSIGQEGGMYREDGKVHQQPLWHKWHALGCP